MNFALTNEIPTLAVHLKKTNLSGGLSLNLSALQAILKHTMPDRDYREKLRERITTYLEHSSVDAPVAVDVAVGVLAPTPGVIAVPVASVVAVGVLAPSALNVDDPVATLVAVGVLAPSAANVLAPLPLVVTVGVDTPSALNVLSPVAKLVTVGVLSPSPLCTFSEGGGKNARLVDGVRVGARKIPTTDLDYFIARQIP